MSANKKINILSIVHDVRICAIDVFLTGTDQHWLDYSLLGLIREKAPIKVDVGGAIGMLITGHF